MYVALLVLMGCSRSTPPDAAVPEQAPIAEVAAPPAPPPVPHTLLRGRLLLDRTPVIFTPCEGGAEAAGGVESIVATVREQLPGASVLYAELAAVEQDGGFVVDGVEMALVEGLGCAVEQADWTWRAFGNEPFWAVEVGEDSALFRSADGVHVQASVTGGASEGGWSWSGRDGDTALSVRLLPGRCRDTMADAFYPWRASVMVGERTYDGCARRRPE